MGGIVIFLGIPGSGKSLQAELLAKRHGWLRMSTGDLLRKYNVQMGEMASGQLLDAEVVEKLVENEMIEIDKDQIIVLDGFPRRTEEVVWLEERVEKWGRPIINVLFLSLSIEEAAERLNSRGRYDDTTEAQERRWREYKEKTLPVTEYYRELGRLIEVNGEGSVEQVSERIEEAIK